MTKYRFFLLEKKKEKTFQIDLFRSIIPVDQSETITRSFSFLPVVYLFIICQIYRSFVISVMSANNQVDDKEGELPFRSSWFDV